MEISHSLYVRIPLKTKFGVQFFLVSDIVCFLIEHRKVKVLLADGNSIRVFHTLKELESAMSEINFYRVHATQLVNLEHINRYNHKTCIIELSNNLSVKVACYRKVDFNKLINKMLPTPLR